MQFTEYSAAEQGHYDWHHDVCWRGQSGQDRKLSSAVQLSDSESYEGGDFEFEDIKTNTDFRKPEQLADLSFLFAPPRDRSDQRHTLIFGGMVFRPTMAIAKK